jgi:hypothetical protein
MTDPDQGDSVLTGGKKTVVSSYEVAHVVIDTRLAGHSNLAERSL